LKHLKSYLEWQHNVPLDKYNTAANSFDGNVSWFGAGQTGAPDKTMVDDSGAVDLHEDDIDLLDEEDAEKTIDRNKRKREKNKKETEIAKADSAPDFLTQWKRFITPHSPGKAG